MTDLLDRPHGLFDENGETLPATEIRKRIKDLPALRTEFENESRASRLSTVERRIIKDSIHCKQCQDNNDPDKVPVHPHCQCDVITDSVEAGVVDPDSRLLNVLNRQLIDIEMAGDSVVPDAIQLNPETAAVLDGENARWADLTRWLEQIQPYLEQGSNYLAIVVDDDTDEAIQQVEEFVSTITEDIEQFPEAIRNKNLWFSLAKSVVL